MPGTHEQRMAALRHANYIRGQRRALKLRWRETGRHQATPEAIVMIRTDWLRTDPRWRTMRLDDLVDAIPSAGDRMLAKMRMRCKVRAGATLGELTERQAQEVAAFLEQWRSEWRDAKAGTRKSPSTSAG